MFTKIIVVYFKCKISIYGVDVKIELGGDIMRFHRPEFVDEFLEWCDAFIATTSLGITEAVLIYSELCNIANTVELFDMLVSRDKYNSDRCLSMSVEEVLAEGDKPGDDEISEEERIGRYEWYAEILGFHGFSEEFVDKFCKNLSPSSENGFSSFKFKGSRTIKTWFINTSYLNKGELEDARHFGLIPYESSFSVRQWSDLFSSLEFTVKTEADPENETPPFSSPTLLLIDQDDLYASVFFLGDCGFPYENGAERTLRAKAQCARHFNFIEQLSAVILLWDRPVTVNIEGYPNPIVHYGLIMSEDLNWRPLILNVKSRRLSVIQHFSQLSPGTIHDLSGEDIRLMEDQGLHTLSALFPRKKVVENEIYSIRISYDVLE